MSVPAQGAVAIQPPSSGIIAPTLPTPPTSIPWVGLLAVLLGTFISTLNTRLSTFGLADIRGAVHAGFDEGAWITTAQTMAQMMIARAAGKHMARIIGYAAVPILLAPILGPVPAGAILQYASWRWPRTPSWGATILVYCRLSLAMTSAARAVACAASFCLSCASRTARFRAAARACAWF